MKKHLWMSSAVLLIACQVQAGFQLTMKSVIDGDKQTGRNQPQGGNSTVRMTTAGDKARIDFMEGGIQGQDDGGYLVTKDAGRTFYLVSPKEKTYMKWDMESMMGMAGAMGNMMKMQVSDPKVEKILDQASQPILGYPTRHYKFRTSYHMSMTVMGFKNEMDITREEETWTTTKLDVSAVSAWFKQAPKTQNAEMDKLIEAEKSKMTGVPLKTVSVQTSTDRQGKATVTRSSMEVTEINKVDNVDVDIPADYQEMDLFGGAGQEEPRGKAGNQGRTAPGKIDFGGLMRKAMESAK